ncbi:MAG: hypothetical protein H6943_03665 [Zoogloeaceae bacterium]|nr:hypothetical protein [Zoogloeaceae bacterium]
MSGRNTAPSGRIHPRTRDLSNIIDRINLWAMAPADEHRKQAVKDSLNTYSKAVKAKKYAAMNRNFAMRTGYCNEAPPPVTDSFESIFGKPETSTNNPPWED